MILGAEIKTIAPSFFDSVVVAVLTVFMIAAISLFTFIIKKLSQHDTALAVLVQAVSPPGDKSLRALLQEIQLDQARATTPNPGGHTGP